jgi:hypothetical protein
MQSSDATYSNRVLDLVPASTPASRFTTCHGQIVTCGGKPLRARCAQSATGYRLDRDFERELDRDFFLRCCFITVRAATSLARLP